MSENTEKKTGGTVGVNGNLLKVGNPGNAGGGRPADEFRRACGEKLDHWLNRADNLLIQLYDEAEDFDSKMKVIEASGKLAERFGKYTGLEKLVTENTGDMTITVRRVGKGDK